jgi:hypothetical protein
MKNYKLQETFDRPTQAEDYVILAIEHKKETRTTTTV